jgi:hypothetical protein
LELELELELELRQKTTKLRLPPPAAVPCRIFVPHCNALESRTLEKENGAAGRIRFYRGVEHSKR